LGAAVGLFIQFSKTMAEVGVTLDDLPNPEVVFKKTLSKLRRNCYQPLPNMPEGPVPVVKTPPEARKRMLV
jgi:hypothetical protein